MAVRATGCKCLRQQAAFSPLPASRRQRTVLPCRAYQQSQASNALQQSSHRSPTPAPYGIPQQQDTHYVEEERHHIEPEDYDMNYYHYQPWWLQPPMIVGTGLAFLVISLIFDDEPTLKTAVLAAGPVALYWGIFLFLLPRQFKTFAVDYMETHPEAEEHIQQQQQQQQEQQ